MFNPSHKHLRSPFDPSSSSKSSKFLPLRSWVCFEENKPNWSINQICHHAMVCAFNPWSAFSRVVVPSPHNILLCPPRHGSHIPCHDAKYVTYLLRWRTSSESSSPLTTLWRALHHTMVTVDQHTSLLNPVTPVDPG